MKKKRKIKVKADKTSNIYKVDVDLYKKNYGQYYSKIQKGTS